MTENSRNRLKLIGFEIAQAKSGFKVLKLLVTSPTAEKRDGQNNDPIALKLPSS